MNIRPEQDGDLDAIRDLVLLAMRPQEAELVEAIRASAHHLPDLALVATEETRVVGHVMVSHVGLEGGTVERIACLAPICVTPVRQRQGIGSELMRAVLERAEARGEPIVVLTGHPSYYPRFGFEPARAIGLEPPDADLPDEVWMAKRLAAYDPSVRGRVVYPPAFATAQDE